MCTRARMCLKYVQFGDFLRTMTKHVDSGGNRFVRELAGVEFQEQIQFDVK